MIIPYIVLGERPGDGLGTLIISVITCIPDFTTLISISLPIEEPGVLFSSSRVSFILITPSGKIIFGQRIAELLYFIRN